MNTKKNKVFEFSINFTQASINLDFLRVIASLEVFLGHFRNLFYVDYAHVSDYSFFVKSLYFLTGFGHQSVVLFFVLSGFFIGSSVLRDFKNKSWSWKKYLINRILRLEAALLPSLLLCAFFDNLGIFLFSENNIYPNLKNGQNVAYYDTSGNLNFNYFLQNILFLQTITVPTYGSNGPLWSLSNEFWYYILFPLLMCFVKGNQKIIYFLLLFITSLFIGEAKLFGFVIWMGGVVVALTPKIILPNLFIKRAIIVTSVLIMMISLGLSRFNILSDYSDYIIGIASSFLVYSIIQIDEGADHRRIKSNKINKIYSLLSIKFATFSYSLYLLHLPLLIFISFFFVRNNRWQPSVITVTISLIILAAVLLYSYCVAQVTELKANDLRKFILKKLHL